MAWVLLVRATVIGFIDYNEGRRALCDCVRYCKRTGQQLRLAATLNNLGAVYEANNVPGERERALTCYRMAASLYEELGYAFGREMPLANLSGFLRTHGEFEAARTYSCERLTVMQASGDDNAIAENLETLAWIDFLAGQYADAEYWISHALDIVHNDMCVRSEVIADVHYTAAGIAAGKAG